MRERRRKHDDVHFPMAVKGARGFHMGSRNGAVLVIAQRDPVCDTCGCAFDSNLHRLYCKAAIPDYASDAEAKPS